MEEEITKVCLSRKDVFCRTKCVVYNNQIAFWLMWIWLPSLVRDATRFETLLSL